ncbi:hypothetical protein [Streptomyces sp. NPDC089919]|uniref:hypothetical protein n=1 Tax=Streptomyces sp. NPDC089919 TaxID=3155188 RepID=UPI00343235DE
METTKEAAENARKQRDAEAKKALEAAVTRASLDYFRKIGKEDLRTTSQQLETAAGKIGAVTPQIAKQTDIASLHARQAKLEGQQTLANQVIALLNSDHKIPHWDDVMEIAKIFADGTIQFIGTGKHDWKLADVEKKIATALKDVSDYETKLAFYKYIAKDLVSRTKTSSTAYDAGEKSQAAIKKAADDKQAAIDQQAAAAAKLRRKQDKLRDGTYATALTTAARGGDQIGSTRCFIDLNGGARITGNSRDHIGNFGALKAALTGLRQGAAATGGGGGTDIGACTEPKVLAGHLAGLGVRNLNPNNGNPGIIQNYLQGNLANLTCHSFNRNKLQNNDSSDYGYIPPCPNCGPWMQALGWRSIYS